MKESTHRTLNRILEAYRTNRTLNQIVSKDEGEPDEKLRLSPSAKKEWDKSMQYWKNKARKETAQDRLKKKGAVPSKDGKKMFEQQELMQEDLNKFISTFRKLYTSPKSLTFRKWIAAMEDLLDIID
jgi:hypothetical protein